MSKVRKERHKYRDDYTSTDLSAAIARMSKDGLNPEQASAIYFEEVKFWPFSVF
jgi:hypothetical protein